MFYLMTHSTHSISCVDYQVIINIWCGIFVRVLFSLWVLYDCAFQPVLHNWCNKGRGMCYPVFCRMVHIKEPLLLIGKIGQVAAAGFPSHYLSGPLPYVQCHITVMIVSYYLYHTFISANSTPYTSYILVYI